MRRARSSRRLVSWQARPYFSSAFNSLTALDNFHIFHARLQPSIAELSTPRHSQPGIQIIIQISTRRCGLCFVFFYTENLKQKNFHKIYVLYSLAYSSLFFFVRHTRSWGWKTAQEENSFSAEKIARKLLLIRHWATSMCAKENLV